MPRAYIPRRDGDRIGNSPQAKEKRRQEIIHEHQQLRRELGHLETLKATQTQRLNAAEAIFKGRIGELAKSYADGGRNRVLKKSAQAY